MRQYKSRCPGDPSHPFARDAHSRWIDPPELEGRFFESAGSQGQSTGADVGWGDERRKAQRLSFPKLSAVWPVSPNSGGSLRSTPATRRRRRMNMSPSQPGFRPIHLPDCQRTARIPADQSPDRTPIASPHPRTTRAATKTTTLMCVGTYISKSYASPEKKLGSRTKIPSDSR